MKFKDLMKEVKAMFNDWMQDKTLDEYYCGNTEEIYIKIS